VKNNQTKHAVAITGIGLVTPLGNTTPSTWANLIAGKSGITQLPANFGLPADYPVTVAGLVQNEAELLAQAFPPKQHSRADRFIHLAMIAGQQAMDDAQLTTEFPTNRERIGTYMGVGFGGLGSVVEAVHSFNVDGPRRVNPFTIPKLVSNMASGWLAMHYNLQGPNMAITSACASSSDAVGLAFRAIRDGYADVMLAGGSESCVQPLTIASFGNMRALATWQGDPAAASRPFDVGRTGFVLAEGAAVLVLERLDHAQARGAAIYALVAGYGASSDAYHMTAMHPDGRGAQQAMHQALADADLTPADVDYINAHGTATPMNDPLETALIKTVFGKRSDPAGQNHVLVSSTKSMTGHMLGATGAAEAAFCALAIKHGIVPPTINLTSPDPACDLDYVAHTARRQTIRAALSNSFGFGGSNAVLALKAL
jgi:3-oxoacyl-[acyl-carrier-protein] synthase II